MLGYNGWFFLRCSHCAVFGHSTEKCAITAAILDDAATKAAAEAAAANEIAEASKVRDTPVGGNEGWMVKSLKRGRGKNSGPKGSTIGLDGGASSSGTTNMVVLPLINFTNWLNQVLVNFMEVVMTATASDNHRVVSSEVNENDGGSKTCPQPLGVISGASVGNRGVGEAISRFVLSQVGKLDEGQKENDLGARDHFLPKSSTQGKNMLNVKGS